MAKNAAQKRKERIRKRDRRRYGVGWVCSLCGCTLPCEIHHLTYHDKYVQDAITHLCEGCHPVMDYVNQR